MIVNERIVVTSLSTLLMSFDVKTGEKIGEFQGEEEMRSNPMWCDPYVLVNRFDSESDQGKLLFFQKLIAVELSPSKISPQKTNEEIVVTATPYGFYLPEYEFYLTPVVKWPLNPYFFVFIGKEEDKQIVQEKSEERTWQWFPEEDGIYSIGVIVTDEKEKADTEIPFLVQKEDAIVALAMSVDSPQHTGIEIGFTATSRGMSSPQYEFSFQRVYELAFFTHMSLFIPGRKRVIQEYSVENTWTWTPLKGGLYVIHVSADDGVEKVTSNVIYSVTEKKSNNALNNEDKIIKKEQKDGS